MTELSGQSLVQNSTSSVINIVPTYSTQLNPAQATVHAIMYVCFCAGISTFMMASCSMCVDMCTLLITI